MSGVARKILSKNPAAEAEQKKAAEEAKMGGGHYHGNLRKTKPKVTTIVQGHHVMKENDNALYCPAVRMVTVSGKKCIWYTSFRNHLLFGRGSHFLGEQTNLKPLNDVISKVFCTGSGYTTQ